MGLSAGELRQHAGLQRSLIEICELQVQRGDQRPAGGVSLAEQHPDPLRGLGGDTDRTQPPGQLLCRGDRMHASLLVRRDEWVGGGSAPDPPVVNIEDQQLSTGAAIPVIHSKDGDAGGQSVWWPTGPKPPLYRCRVAQLGAR